MEEEEHKPSNRENHKKEEEIYHENILNFVREICAEEVFALHEEVEGKLLHIPFIDNENEDPVQRVFPDILGDPKIEEELEDEQKKKINGKDDGELVIEELKVVGEESHPLSIFLQ